MNIIKQLDIFPKQPKLYLGRKENHKTFIGAMFSLGIICLTVVFSYFFGKDVVERKFPIMIRSSGEVKIPPIVSIDPINLPLIVGVLDFATQLPYRDDKLFTIRFMQYQTERFLNDKGLPDFQFTQTTVEAENCDKKKHIQNPAMDDILTQIDLKKFYCVPKNFMFGGSWDDNVSYAFAITIDRCDSQTKECKSEEAISSALDRGYLTMYFPQFNIDPASENPITKYSKAAWTSFSRIYKQTVIVNFKTYQISIDKGFLFEDKVISPETGFSGYREMVDNLPGDTIIRVNFQVDTSYEEVIIKYKKVQEVLAEIGGFINIVVIIIGVLLFKYQQIDFQNELIKQAFTWKKRRIFQKSSNNNFDSNLQIRSMDSGLAPQNSEKLRKTTDQIYIKSQLNSDEKNIDFNQVQDLENEPEFNQRKEEHDAIESKQATFRENQNTQVEQLKSKFRPENNAVSPDQELEYGYVDKVLTMSEVDEVKVLLGFQDQGDMSTLFRVTDQEIMDKMNIECIIKKLEEIDLLKMLLLTDQQHQLFMGIKKQTFIYVDPEDFQKAKSMDNHSCRQEIVTFMNEKDLKQSKIDQNEMALQQIREIAEKEYKNKPDKGTCQKSMSINQKLFKLLDNIYLMFRRSSDSNDDFSASIQQEHQNFQVEKYQHH